mgnify:CR=1 FL=1
MKITRLRALAVLGAAGVLGLTACTGPTSEVIEDSTISVAVNLPFTSVNGATTAGDATANATIASATNSSFSYFDDAPELVRDESFGTVELVSDDPLVVKYTIADGVKWSDGTAVDAVDLLLNWAALSRSLDTPDFDPLEFTDPQTGEFTEAFPDDVVYFDSGADPEFGLGLVRETPTISDDHKSLTLTYSVPFADWELELTDVGLPAHVIAERVLDATSADNGKAAILDAIQNDDADALASISSFWNTGFNLTAMPGDPDLLVSNGPYVITDFVADQYVTLTANEQYVGDRRPKIEALTVRFISDPLAAAQALQNGVVQVIAPTPTAEVFAALANLDVTVRPGIDLYWEHLELQLDQSKSGHFNNPLIREAFMKVIPRQAIIDELIAPIAPTAKVRNSQVFIPGTPEYIKSVAVNGSSAFSEVDVAGAAALLAQAGVSNPEVCILYAPSNPRRVKEFTMIQESAAQAGFVVTDCSSPTWDEQLGVPGAYDAALFSWQPTGLGVNNGPVPIFATDGFRNFTFAANPTMDELTAELSVAVDSATQVELLQQIDALAWADFVGVPIFQYPTVTAFDPLAVTNVTRSPVSTGIFWNVWDWAPVAAVGP